MRGIVVCLCVLGVMWRVHGVWSVCVCSIRTDISRGTQDEKLAMVERRREGGWQGGWLGRGRGRG